MERQMSSDMEDLTPSEIFELSKTTTVEWIAGGQLLICRRKRRFDGSLSPFPYEVYVHPEICISILDNLSKIQTSMSCVKSQKIPNPANVELGGGRIIQCSVFNGSPKFGIHLMENGPIARRKGLNLSPEEFNQLINFLSYSPPQISKPAESNFTVTQYQYEWKSTDPAEKDANMSDAFWHISPEACLKAGEQDNPILEDYELSFISRNITVEINEHLVDAAAARLILHNIEVEKTMEAMNNRLLDYYDEAGNDLLTYGPRVSQSITKSDIFNLCLKALKMSDNVQQSHIEHLMRIVIKRGKHSDALDFLKKGKLNQTYVDIFLDIDV